MKLDDFIKNSEGLSLKELEVNQLKEVNGGGQMPVKTKLQQYCDSAEFYYLRTYEDCYTC